MNRFCRTIAGSCLRLAACALAATLAGCAAGGGNSLADFKDDKALEKALADDTFPTAAESGLASNDRSRRKTR